MLAGFCTQTEARWGQEARVQVCPVLDPTLKGDKPLGAGLLGTEEVWPATAGWGDGDGRTGKGAELRTGCELVTLSGAQGCGFRAQKGPGLEIQPGNSPKSTPGGVQGELWEADRTGRHRHLTQGRCLGRLPQLHSRSRERQKNREEYKIQRNEDNRNHVVGVSVFHTTGRGNSHPLTPQHLVVFLEPTCMGC